MSPTEHQTAASPHTGANREPPVAVPRPQRVGRKKLWDVSDHFHCSIVGTCLTLGELRRFAKKARLFPRGKVSDHELHGAFVGMVGESGCVSRLVQKHLERKYKGPVREFANANTEEAMAVLWDEAVASGEVAGAYWALMTQPDMPPRLIERVYGEIHMMSHLSGASCRADMQELVVLRARGRHLEEQLGIATAAAHRKAALHNEAIQTSDARLALLWKTEEKLRETEARLRVFEKQDRFGRLQSQVEEYAALLADVRARAERAEAAAEEWKRLALRSGDRHLLQEQELAELESERGTLEAALEKLLAPDCASCESQDQCRRDEDLGGLCILYVGGRHRQCAHFRALVERQNGRFIHHDGGLDDGRQRLGSILPQVDAVLCPLDCVSHDAANRVKQFCKHNGKPLVFLPRSSLAAFTRGLNELAA